MNLTNMLQNFVLIISRGSTHLNDNSKSLLFWISKQTLAYEF